MTTWTAKVGLRKPEPRPAIGLMQVVSETYAAQMQDAVNRTLADMEAVKRGAYPMRVVPYDQGGWIPGPADPIPTGAVGCWVTNTSDVDEPIEVDPGGPEHVDLLTALQASIDRHRTSPPFCVRCTSAVCVCGVGR